MPQDDASSFCKRCSMHFLNYTDQIKPYDDSGVSKCVHLSDKKKYCKRHVREIGDKSYHFFKEYFSRNV